MHCATADQARVVADLYFAGQQDLKLLRVSVESLPKDTTWTRESDDDVTRPVRASPCSSCRLNIKKVQEPGACSRGGTFTAAPPLPGVWSTVLLPLVDRKHTRFRGAMRRDRRPLAAVARGLLDHVADETARHFAVDVVVVPRTRIDGDRGDVVSRSGP